GASVTWDERNALCLVLASDGYPAAPRKGQIIEGEIYSAIDDEIQVFHAGTSSDDQGSCLVSGGRVLGVTALADSLVEAKELVYARAAMIHFDGKIHRSDIGTFPGSLEPTTSIESN
ncbi:MAG: phosphoribosylglycinamide synthetase C domain-containing protein, partial [Planctomycetota bacterium]